MLDTAELARLLGEVASEFEAIAGTPTPGGSPSAVRQLEAVLKPPASAAEMHVEANSAVGRVLSLHLSVDDYPRAFYYRVPVSGETSDLPEDADLLAARIVALPKGTIYKPPLASIPVAIEVDAPGAGQTNPALRVEVGIDRDRELAGDETLVLNSDRQVRADLVGIRKAGELQIQTTVRDFTVDVPAAALSNGRANMLVHLVLGDREAWKAEDSPPPLATATTGANGQFRFPKVAPGKYVIAAEGLVRNKTRRAEGRISFQKPAELQPVTLKLE